MYNNLFKMALAAAMISMYGASNLQAAGCQASCIEECTSQIATCKSDCDAKVAKNEIPYFKRDVCWNDCAASCLNKCADASGGMPPKDDASQGADR